MNTEPFMGQVFCAPISLMGGNMSLKPDIIRESFEKAKPIAEQVVSSFYDNLFADYPQAKGLFQDVDNKKQIGKLIGSLVFIVDNLENSEKLVSYLENLGSRHIYYDVEDEHYDWVGASLLKTFKQYLKDDWTKEVEEQWTIAYGVIATTMKDGARKTKNKVA